MIQKLQEKKEKKTQTDFLILPSFLVLLRIFTDFCVNKLTSKLTRKWGWSAEMADPATLLKLILWIINN